MAYLSSMKSGSLSGDISKGQGLESSGGSSPFISATWAGVTQRLDSAGTLDEGHPPAPLPCGVGDTRHSGEVLEEDAVDAESRE